MPLLSVSVTAASDPGRVRDNNEDSVAFEPAGSPRAAERGVLCVVADGVGGQAAGEVASSTAVRVVLEHYYRSRSPDLAAALRSAVEDANAEVWRQAGGDLERTGMASTCTAAVVHRDTLILAHVGDSRAYLVRGGSIHQLTTDHSQVAQLVAAGVLTPEEARRHPNRNIILRALGREATVEVDVLAQPVRDGDTIVLCSDGLSGVVADADIAALAARGTLDEAAARLIARANEGGAPDNVTVGLLQIGRRPAPVAAGHPAVTASETPTVMLGDGPATMVGRPVPVDGEVQPAPRRNLLPLLAILLGLLALLVVVGLGSVFFLRARESSTQVEPQAPKVAATLEAKPTTEAPPLIPPVAIPTPAPAPTSAPAATIAPTSPSATQPLAPTLPPSGQATPTAPPAPTVPPPTSQPSIGSALAPPPAVEAPSRPVIVSQPPGGDPPTLDPALARALEDASVADDAREICRQVRPDRPIQARLRDQEIVRVEPDPAAPVVGPLGTDAAVTVLECVLGAPAAESRIWLRLGDAPTGGAGLGFIPANRVASEEPRDVPSGGGPGRSLGSEPSFPAPAASPAPLQNEPFESKPVPGQLAPSEPGSLNRR